MIKIFVLGQKGMLGNAVIKYFTQNPEKYEIETTGFRWGESKFEEILKKAKADFIINCIGATPQKYSNQTEKYKELNIDLPIFLETLKIKIIHPSTDCEFSGNLPLGQKYKKISKRDAEDDYGKSKALISEKIEKQFVNTKIIRTSIIGHELSEDKFSLLEWAISSKDPIKGFVDHYWNGITTLEWAKICEDLILNWESKPVLNQYGIEDVLNKYKLIKLILNIYNHKINVDPHNTGQNINKCLESDVSLKNIDEQIKELKKFYNR